MGGECAPPELKDIELKMGCKVPESLLRALREDRLGRHREVREEEGAPRADPQTHSRCSARERLQTKICLLKLEMAHLRAIDGKLMHQLLSINEGIESIKWLMEDKDTVASRGSSLASSLYSLVESQDTSHRGSCNSLQNGSDELDGISVGSYLDTLADDLPDRYTPNDLDAFSDGLATDDSHNTEPIKKACRDDSDDGYYCFG
uniref:Leucine rich adaptor protein 1-like protein n=1 Tax=Callorhinchus milii TaxID=7868 RepID=K4FU53_CALMI|nr:hypothetical protein [Callorhinchus milii]